MSSTASCTTLNPTEFTKLVSDSGADFMGKCPIRARYRLEPSEKGNVMVFEVTTNPGWLNYTNPKGQTLHGHPDSEFCEMWRQSLIANLQMSEEDWSEKSHDIASWITYTFKAVSDDYHEYQEVDPPLIKERETSWDPEKQELTARFNTECESLHAPMMRVQFRVGEEHCMAKHGSRAENLKVDVPKADEQAEAQDQPAGSKTASSTAWFNTVEGDDWSEWI